MTPYPKPIIKKKKKPKSSSDRKKLIRQLDDVVRQILKKGPDTCVCCGKSGLGWFHPKTNPYGLQVGHYVSRTSYALRWELKNTHPQCSGCNQQHNVNPVPYTQYMINRYGNEVLEELTAKKRDLGKYKNSQLRELLEELERST